jgi:integrase
VLEVFGVRRLVEGLRPADFTELRRQIAATRGATATGTEMTRIRVLFNWAYQSGLVEVPIRYGPEFRRPSKRLLRLEQEGKTKLFESEEILALLGAAEAVLRPMILLGINAGLGNADVGRLRFDHLDLESGWVVFPRPKTGIRRTCPLWPETVEAIRAWLSQRPEAESPETRELVFLTRRRQGWHKEGRMEDPLSLRFRKLTQAADCYRRRRGFYALRHTFETIAGGAKDQVAVDAIMGHVDATMAGHYRHGISSRRLIDVVDYVHDWLYRARRVLPDRRTGEEIERER